MTIEEKIELVRQSDRVNMEMIVLDMMIKDYMRITMKQTPEQAAEESSGVSWEKEQGGSAPDDETQALKERIDKLDEDLKEMTEYAHEKRSLLLEQVDLTTKLNIAAYNMEQETIALKELLKGEVSRRERGFYWVFWYGSYSAAYWTGLEWYVINSTEPLQDTDFEHIIEEGIKEPFEHG